MRRPPRAHAGAGLRTRCLSRDARAETAEHKCQRPHDALCGPRSGHFQMRLENATVWIHAC